MLSIEEALAKGLHKFVNKQKSF
jgi:hypothetical protein